LDLLLSGRYCRLAREILFFTSVFCIVLSSDSISSYWIMSPGDWTRSRLIGVRLTCVFRRWIKTLLWDGIYLIWWHDWLTWVQTWLFARGEARHVSQARGQLKMCVPICFKLFICTDSLAYRPVAKQWLCKQWPLLANARNIHAYNNRGIVGNDAFYSVRAK
jgi:hypothetical protein